MVVEKRFIGSDGEMKAQICGQGTGITLGREGPSDQEQEYLGRYDSHVYPCIVKPTVNRRDVRWERRRANRGEASARGGGERSERERGASRGRARAHDGEDGAWSKAQDPVHNLQVTRSVPEDRPKATRGAIEDASTTEVSSGAGAYLVVGYASVAMAQIPPLSDFRESRLSLAKS